MVGSMFLLVLLIVVFGICVLGMLGAVAYVVSRSNRQKAAQMGSYDMKSCPGCSAAMPEHYATCSECGKSLPTP